MRFLHLVTLATVTALTGCYAGTLGKPNAKKRQYKRSLVKKPKKAPRVAARVVKLRVYADQELRAQRVMWKTRLQKLVKKVNPVLERELHLRLVVEVTKPWQRKASADNMPAMVRELEALDPGGEVEWVLGLVTPLSYTTTSLHNLAMARIDGRHIVIRSAAPQPGRENRLEPQLVEAIALIHEVGHILGATHARDERHFMFPQLRGNMREYEPERAKAMRANLHARFTEPAKREAARKRAEENRRRNQMISGLTALIETAARATNRAQALQLLATAGARLDKMKLADDGLYLRLATAFAAQQALTFTERALARMSTPMPKHATTRWAIKTRARAAMPRKGPGRIPLELEAAYIELVNQTIAAVTGSKPKRTRALLRAVAKRFPKSAGLAVARCYHAIYSARMGAARKHCQRALRIHPGSSWAHYLLGFLERHRKRPAKAAARMATALKLDPYLQPAWRDLAEVYSELKDTAALAKLKAAYQETFGQPMPDPDA